jgi:hypothetical protein
MDIDIRGEVDLSRLRSGLSTHLCGLPFECQGAFAAQRWMASAWIIESVDMLEYSPFRLGVLYPNGCARSAPP